MAQVDPRVLAWLRIFQQQYPQTASARIEPASWGAFHEGGGQRDYTPALAADPSRGTIEYNPAGDSVDDAGYINFGVGHELGHLLEPQLVRNRSRADLLQKIMGSKRGTPWLAHSPQGRGERKTGPALRRDQSGVPTQGPRGAHSAPNEKYADLVSRSMSGDRSNLIKRMQALKLLPSRRSTFAHGGGKAS